MRTTEPLPAEAGEVTLVDLLLRNAEKYGQLPALSWRGPEEGAWTTLTWAGVLHEVELLASAYAALGVRRGEHVLLMMANRPEHWLSDMALVHLGAVPVSVYGSAAPEQIAHIVRHSRARFAVVEGAAGAERWEPLLDEADNALSELVVVDEGDGGAGRHRTYASLAEQGARLLDRAALERARGAVRAGDPLTVVYTSGTTGTPKGVVVSHRGIVRNAVALDRAVEMPDHGEHLCYLPLAHIAERMLGIYLAVFRASHVYLCAEPAAVAAAVRELHPVQFFAVPRVWEKFAAAVKAALARLPEERRAAVEAAGETARAHAAHRERGQEVPAELAAAYARAKAEVLDPLLSMAGLERLTRASSASAPMPREVVDFWAGLGIVIMDAWGLTETVGVTTANRPDGFRLGSVGRPIEGLEIRTAQDGEIEVRGATLFDGYLRPDGTVEPATDAEGWFATGDIGRIDADGYLWVTDRKKEMIITSGGKNVSPALVENTLKEHPLIGQALAYGDGRPYLVALLVLDDELAPAWAAARKIRGRSLPELAVHPLVREEAERAVAAANARLNRSEQVKRFSLLSEEWSPQSGELTPSLKLRRRIIQEKYAQTINGLYLL